jgi:hypothetical protein
MRFVSAQFCAQTGRRRGSCQLKTSQRATQQLHRARSAKALNTRSSKSNEQGAWVWVSARMGRGRCQDGWMERTPGTEEGENPSWPLVAKRRAQLFPGAIIRLDGRSTLGLHGGQENFWPPSSKPMRFPPPWSDLIWINTRTFAIRLHLKCRTLDVRCRDISLQYTDANRSRMILLANTCRM